jgi:hypothetical protein
LLPGIIWLSLKAGVVYLSIKARGRSAGMGSKLVPFLILAASLAKGKLYSDLQRLFQPPLRLVIRPITTPFFPLTRAAAGQQALLTQRCHRLRVLFVTVVHAATARW